MQRKYPHKHQFNSRNNKTTFTATTLQLSEQHPHNHHNTTTITIIITSSSFRENLNKNHKKKNKFALFSAFDKTFVFFQLLFVGFWCFSHVFLSKTFQTQIIFWKKWKKLLLHHRLPCAPQRMSLKQYGSSVCEKQKKSESFFLKTWQIKSKQMCGKIILKSVDCEVSLKNEKN